MTQEISNRHLGKKRLPNFELLRTLAMLMVVVWHFHVYGLGYGEESVVSTSTVGLFNYAVSHYIMVVCSTCVNLFVLLSSYFLVDKAFNWTRVLKLWVSVLFYAVIFALIAHFMLPERHPWKEVLDNLMPIGNRSYWFATSYVGLVFMAPFLSKIVSTLSQKQYVKFLFVLILLGCSFYRGFPWGSVMKMDGGYSLIWFIFLFFWSGYFRRFKVDVPSSKIIVVFFILSVIVWGTKVGGPLIRYFLYHGDIHNQFFYYNGSSLFLSLLLFLWFQRLSIKENGLTKMLIRLAPYTFGVYLIHDNPLVRAFFWVRLYDWTSFLESPFLVLVMVLTVVVLFLFCSIVEYCRIIVFGFLQIDSFAERLSIFIKRWINSLSCWLQYGKASYGLKR